MKQILYIMLFILFLAVILAARQIKDLQEENSRAMANIKAFSAQFKEQDIAYQMTIGQLKQFGDSLMLELDNVRRDLKVKDKNVKTLQYVGSTFTKRDTLILLDTLFKEPSLALDTTLGNEWYNVRIGLNYPSTIMVSPKVRSEKYIVAHTKRETINPPKKFFLFRWFQKKHTVVHVDVVEKNPYIENTENRYIEIVK